jgi:hypothetical protein
LCIGEIGRRGLPAAVDLLGGGAVGIATSTDKVHGSRGTAGAMAVDRLRHAVAPRRPPIAFTRSVPHNQIFCFDVEVRAAGQEQPMLLPQLWQR